MLRRRLRSFPTSQPRSNFRLTPALFMTASGAMRPAAYGAKRPGGERPLSARGRHPSPANIRGTIGVRSRCASAESERLGGSRFAGGSVRPRSEERWVWSCRRVRAWRGLPPAPDRIAMSIGRERGNSPDARTPYHPKRPGDAAGSRGHRAGERSLRRKDRVSTPPEALERLLLYRVPFLWSRRVRCRPTTWTRCDASTT